MCAREAPNVGGMNDDVDLSALSMIQKDFETVTDDDRSHVLEQLAKKRWDDLGVIEDGPELLFPENIWKRGKDGKFVSVPCLLRVARGDELRKARVTARSIAQEDGIDEHKDRDLFENLDTLCTVWFSIRDTAAPFAPLCGDPRELERLYNKSLPQVIGKVAQLKRVLDPKVSGMSTEELMLVAGGIVERQNLSPLFAFEDATQARFVITSAALLHSYLKARSSAGSPARSTADSPAPPS